MNAELESRMDKIHPIILHEMPKGTQWYKNMSIKDINELEIKIAEKINRKDLLGDWERNNGR